MSLSMIEQSQSKSQKSRLMTTALQNRGRASAGIALGLSVCLLVSSKAEASTFKFQKVVDTKTSIPGGTGNFTNLSPFVPPSTHQGSVAFFGSGSDSQSGIYLKVGTTLKVVANPNTPIPSDTGKFSSFGTPSLGNGNVAFLGIGSNFFVQQGIYTNIGGTLKVVADYKTPIPGGTGNFTEFNRRGSVYVDPSLNSGNIAFRGYGGSSQAGIYTNIGGKLNVVANTNTPIPRGTGKFGDFSDSVIDEGRVAFIGTGSSFPLEQGIYTNVSGTLKAVVDTNTAIPGGSGNFSRFTDYFASSEQTRIAFDNGNVAFNGFGSNNQQGIYTNIGGKLNVVANTNTLIPGGTGKFARFSTPCLDNGNVAFAANEGIYTNLGGSLTKVIAANDSLNGKIVRSVSTGREALSQNRIAFFVEFTDGSRGIYVATLSQ